MSDLDTAFALMRRDNIRLREALEQAWAAMWAAGWHSYPDIDCMEYRAVMAAREALDRAKEGD